jgi:hypothetical protein
MGLSHEVILVFDRQPSARTLSELQNAFPALKVEVSPEPGASRARNHGLQTARGETFLLLDDDCIPSSKDVLGLVIQIANGSGHLHGGSYELPRGSTYSARIYNWVNRTWLKNGSQPGQSQRHLLGGFLFGSKTIQNAVRFPPGLPWGGEEKVMLQNLIEKHRIHAKWHADLSVVHHDRSGILKLIKRAFLQGRAAGQDKNHLAVPWTTFLPPVHLLPGVAFFYFFSRIGLIAGVLRPPARSRRRTPYTSPNP